MQLLCWFHWKCKHMRKKLFLRKTEEELNEQRRTIPNSPYKHNIVDFYTIQKFWSIIYSFLNVEVKTTIVSEILSIQFSFYSAKMAVCNEKYKLTKKTENCNCVYRNECKITWNCIKVTHTKIVRTSVSFLILANSDCVFSKCHSISHWWNAFHLYVYV